MAQPVWEPASLCCLQKRVWLRASRWLLRRTKLRDIYIYVFYLAGAPEGWGSWSREVYL